MPNSLSHLPATLKSLLSAPSPFHNSSPTHTLLSHRSLGGSSFHSCAFLETSAGPRFAKWNDSAPHDLFPTEARGLQILRSANSGLCIPAVYAILPSDSPKPSAKPKFSGTESVFGPSTRPRPGATQGTGSSTAPSPSPTTASGGLLLEWLEPSSGGPQNDEDLGRGLAALHRQSAPAFGFDTPHYLGSTRLENGWESTWPDFLIRRRLTPLIETLQARGDLTATQRHLYDRLLARLPTLLSDNPGSTDPEKPALIHGDLWPGNHFPTRQGPALFDPAAYYGHREMEWGMMFLFGGFPDRVLSAYQEAWPLAPGWRERLPLHQLTHLLNHQLLFGGSYGAQALAVAKRFAG